ncbi:MAG: hypothetical protein J5877_03210 [Clostridia bacterium]|nr:hypothetical protein [Clostridia bacterium]
MKKIFTAIFSLATVLSVVLLISISAHAAEFGGEVKASELTDKAYSCIDLTEDTVLTLDRDITFVQIDCNGHKFTVKGDHTLTLRGEQYYYHGIYEASVFTLESGTVNCNGAKYSGCSGICNRDRSYKIVINGGSFIFDNCQYGIDARGDIIINGGYIDINMPSSHGINTYGKIDINGGTIEIDTEFWQSSGYGSCIDGYGLEIYDATVACVGTIRSDGDLIIGATANVSANSGLENQPAIYVFCSSGTMKVSGHISTPSGGRVKVLPSGGGSTWYTITADGETNASEVVINRINDGWLTEDGKTYYYENGIRAKGLKTIEDKIYYFGSDGAMYVKRLISVSGKKYYMGADGAAYTKKLISVKGKKYYMGADGVAYTSRLISVNGKKYYMGKDGVAYVSKLISVDGKKYYMGKDAVAYTSKLASIDGKKYYFGKDGVAYKSKLISVSGKKYYIGKDCVAYKSKFASISGKKYYFGSDCVMYKSKTFSVSGVKWKADKNGVCKKV